MSAEQFSEEFGNSIFSVLNPASFDAAFNFEDIFGFFNGFRFCSGTLQFNQ